MMKNQDVASIVALHVTEFLRHAEEWWRYVPFTLEWCVGERGSPVRVFDSAEHMSAFLRESDDTFPESPPIPHGVVTLSTHRWYYVRGKTVKDSLVYGLRHLVLVTRDPSLSEKDMSRIIFHLDAIRALLNRGHD